MVATFGGGSRLWWELFESKRGSRRDTFRRFHLHILTIGINSIFIFLVLSAVLATNPTMQ